MLQSQPPAILSRMLRPRQIAFVGGAQVSGPIRACKRAGYQGEIWAVNPTRDEIEGIPCIPTVSALPAPPDAAVIALSPDRSIEAVEQLARMGAGGAAVISSGFAELKGEGAGRQQRLKQAAGAMPVIGPNCMGILNQFDGAAVWGDDNHIERPEGPAAAIISQSGAILIGITNVEQAFPLGYAISTGNQAIVGVAECIEAILEDDRVRAIGLYLEGMNDGEEVGRACFRALEKGVPVVALKGGDQAAGAAVAISHTASMVVERDLWDAFCARFGLVEVSSPKALVETLKLLTIGGVPKGNRVSIISYSGGLNGLAAAKAGPLGLQLPMPTQENQSRLRELLPETVTLTNPLDLNIPFKSKSAISLEDTQGVAKAITAFARDVADQIVFFVDVPRPGAASLDRVWRESLEALTQVRNDLNIPCSVAGILPEGLQTEFRQHLVRNGVAPLLGYSETMEALAVSAKLHNLQAAGLALPDTLYRATAAEAGTIVNEAESKRRLACLGLQTPPFEAVPIAEAFDAADRLGYPVALKVLSNKIAHKAKAGGVRLGLRNAEEVSNAASQISSDVAAAPDGHPVTHVLVERMVDGAFAEVIIGIKRHAALGLALMIGRGGSAAEELHTFETLLLPLQDHALEDAISRLGYRGHTGLLQAARAVAAYAGENRHRLITLDVNPVMLTHEGKALAADALIVLAAHDS